MWTRITAALVALGVLAGGVAVAETRHVTGTATYLERMALPPGAVLEVYLRDVSRQDVAATELSSDRIEMQGVPTTFSLPYDPAGIDAAGSYAVHAEIRLNGRLLFISTTQTPVLTRGAGDTVEMVLSRVTSSVSGLEGTEWTVTQLGDQPIEMDRPPTLAFGLDGEFGAFGGCNTFRGQAQAQDGALTVSDNLAGTLMACRDAINVLERRFLDLLRDSSVYAQVGEELVLKDAGGAVLIRARPGV